MIQRVIETEIISFGLSTYAVSFTIPYKVEMAFSNVNLGEGHLNSLCISSDSPLNQDPSYNFNASIVLVDWTESEEEAQYSRFGTDKFELFRRQSSF